MTTTSTPAEKSNWGRVVEVLRWGCVLPAAYMAGMVSGVFFGYLVLLAMERLGNRGESRLGYWVCHAVVVLSKSVVFVLAGTLVAPSRRTQTAAVLAGIACVVALVVHVISRSRVGITNYRDFAAEAVGAIVAAAVVALILRKNRVVPAAVGDESAIVRR